MPPRPEWLTRCVNRHLVDVSGKSLCGDRCPPAAAAHKETRLEGEGGASVSGRWSMLKLPIGTKISS